MTFIINFSIFPIMKYKAIYLPPANEVCEGYVFTRVCTSVHRGEYLGRYPHRDQVHPPPPGPGTSPLGPSTPPGTRYTPPTLDQAHPREQCMLGDTDNKRAVRILLECILVLFYCTSDEFTRFLCVQVA